HRIGRVIEHDLDHDGLAALIGEPVVGEVVLDPDEPITLATGDAFVADAHVRAGLAERAHLVDMEGYAVARACEAAGVPCELVKVVSDTASEGAATSWKEQADRTARLIAEVVRQRLGCDRRRRQAPVRRSTRRLPTARTSSKRPDSRAGR